MERIYVDTSVFGGYIELIKAPEHVRNLIKLIPNDL